MKDEFELVTAATNEYPLPKIDRSWRQSRKVRALWMVARRLGSLKKPSFLRADGIKSILIRVVKQEFPPLEIFLQPKQLLSVEN